MGKSKTTKFKRPQMNAVGLPVSLKELDGQEDDHGGDSCPAAELLEKVGAPSLTDTWTESFLQFT